MDDCRLCIFSLGKKKRRNRRKKTICNLDAYILGNKKERNIVLVIGSISLQAKEIHPWLSLKALLVQNKKSVLGI